MYQEKVNVGTLLPPDGYNIRMKKYIPREHGVWLLLLLPALVGLFADISGESGAEHLTGSGKLAFFIFLLTSFFLTVPAQVLRKGKEDIKEYFPGIAVTLLLWCGSFLVLQQEGKALLLFGALSPLIFFFLAGTFIDIVRHPGLKACMPFVFPFSGVAAVLLRNDAALSDAFSLYALFICFFYPRHVYTVEHFIQKGGKECFKQRTLFVTLLSLCGACVLLLFQLKNLILLLVLLCFFLSPLYIILRRVQWQSIKQYGRQEMYISILFSMCIFFLY